VKGDLLFANTRGYELMADLAKADIVKHLNESNLNEPRKPTIDLEGERQDLE
jgi:hypothetical protein